MPPENGETPSSLFICCVRLAVYVSTKFSPRQSFYGDKCFCSCQIQNIDCAIDGEHAPFVESGDDGNNVNVKSFSFFSSHFAFVESVDLNKAEYEIFNLVLLVSIHFHFL